MALLMLVLLCLGPVASADATPPSIAIEQPLAASYTNNQLPSFSGTSEDEVDPVTVSIYAGPSAEGTPVSTISTLSAPEGKWAIASETTLEPGQYTAVAEQEGATSEPVTFTIDTTAPSVSIEAVASFINNPAPTLSGSVGTEPGDIATVTVTVYKGSSTGGEVASTGEATLEGEAWHYIPNLTQGTYTAVASQSDEAGNTGTSVPATTFTVDTTAPALTISSPASLAILPAAKTTFSGLAGQAEGDEPTIDLSVFAGTTTSGSPSQTLEVSAAGGKWTTGSSGPTLSNGTYTLEAEQSDQAGNIATRTVTFTVDANAPVVTLDTSSFTKRESAFFTNSTPSFNGSGSTGSEDGKTVVLKIFSGSSTSGSLIRSVESTLVGSSWEAGPLAALAEGTYTAIAEQEGPLGQDGASNSFTFNVDAQAPTVTLTSPVNAATTTSSSEQLSGAAATAPGDSATVTVQLYAGEGTAGKTPLQAVSVQAAAGTWSATLGGLTPGTYSAEASQSDDVGNVGHSAPTTFTVTVSAPIIPPAPIPPVASFQSFPSHPRVGEAVSLVSTSTDATSPLTAFAWSVDGGAFTTAGATLSTSFATPGPHVVQLRVSDANGLSSVATQTITAISTAPTLMQPFPVVRIAGSQSPSSVRITLLSVQAPIGASVTVTCGGRGCPAKHRVTVLASAKSKSRAGVVAIAFKRFQRTLRPGAVLEIRISAAGQIGKYTRFTIRRGKLPLRLDTCLSPGGARPVACPS